MALGMNRVMLLGDVAMDPETYVTRSGRVVLSLRLSTAERYLDDNDMPRERTSYHPVVVFGKRAEALSKVVRRGARVFVEGVLRTHDFEGRDGRKVSRTEVVASEVLFAGERAEAAEFSRGFLTGKVAEREKCPVGDETIDAARELAREARARANAATDPPWVAVGQYDDGAVVAEFAPYDIVRAPQRRGLDGNECEANARFAAAARTDVPALADAVEALADRCERAEAIAAAERAMRKSVEEGFSTRTDEATLRALGVDP